MHANLQLATIPLFSEEFVSLQNLLGDRRFVTDWIDGMEDRVDSMLSEETYVVLGTREMGRFNDAERGYLKLECHNPKWGVIPRIMTCEYELSGQIDVVARARMLRQYKREFLAQMVRSKRVEAWFYE